MKKVKKNFLGLCLCCSLVFIATFANAATYNNRFFRAVDENNVKELENQIKKGIYVNSHRNDSTGLTALIIASTNNFKDIVELLIANKADVNAKCNFGCCIPLLKAAEHGNIEIMKILLANEADINATITNGDTSLIYATLNGQVESVKFLIANKADINIKNKNYETALDIANANEYTEIANLLKSAGAK